jgi:hypothetical protein
MILGLKAGGLGLNLTCADRGILVYVFEPFNLSTSIDHRQGPLVE